MPDRRRLRQQAVLIAYRRARPAKRIVFDPRDAMRVMLAAIDSEDWAALAAVLHPHSRYEAPGYAPLEGRDAIVDYYARVRPITTGVHRVEGVIAEGNRAISWGRFRGRTRTGAEVDVGFADLAEFEHGLIRARRVYLVQPMPAAQA